MTDTPAQWRLRDYLAVPFIVEAETVDDGTGLWIRRVSCPQLPDCVATAPTIEAALQQLERRRIEVILALLRAGRSPPMPQPPLSDYDPEGVLARLGLPLDAQALLDCTAAEIAKRA